MQVFVKTKELKLKKPCGICLGNFDGLHLGHMMLIHQLLYQSKLNDLYGMVYTFDTHPQKVLGREYANYLLMSNEKKNEILHLTGLDGLYFEEFSEAFSKISPEDFAKEILVKRFGVKLVVVGENYRFGHRGSGNVELLRDLGDSLGFQVKALPLLHQGEEVVSSTNIRRHLSVGNLEKVLSLQGRYFSMKGLVLHGQKIGRKLGYPTANILVGDFYAIPKTGVYVTKTLLEGKYYNSITNIGTNPTLSTNQQLSIETHIFDFDRDIYGREIEVLFMKRLRDEIKFDGIEPLKEQMKLDCLEALKNFIM